MIKLFHGKESFLSLREVKREIADIKNLNPKISVTILEAPNYTTEEILNHISSQDMFVEQKILFLKRISTHKQKEDILEYFARNKENLYKQNYYFFWEDSKIASNTKYFKIFENIAEKTELNKPSFYSLIKDELVKHQISSDRETISLLASRVNFKPERLIQELEKLGLLGIKALNPKIVLSETVDTLEEVIWNLTKAINSSDKKTVFSILDKLFSQQVDSNFIISMIARNIRLFTQVKYLQEKRSASSQICSILKIPPFTLPELIQAAKNSSWEKIRYIYEKLSSLDYEIKRGNIDGQTGLILILNRT